MWLFIAKNLNKTISKLDSDEFLEVLYFNLDDLVKMVWLGVEERLKLIHI